MPNNLIAILLGLVFWGIIIGGFVYLGIAISKSSYGCDDKKKVVMY